MNEMKESMFQKLGNRVILAKGKLPRVEWFRVDIDGGTGSKKGGEKVKAWHSTGYRLIVKLQGIDGEYATSTVAAAYGMKVKRIYKTIDEAKADGFKFKKQWGRGKKSETAEAEEAKIRAKVIAELAKMTPEHVAELLKRVA